MGASWRGPVPAHGPHALRGRFVGRHGPGGGSEDELFTTGVPGPGVSPVLLLPTSSIGGPPNRSNCSRAAVRGNRTTLRRARGQHHHVVLSSLGSPTTSETRSECPSARGDGAARHGRHHPCDRRHGRCSSGDISGGPGRPVDRTPRPSRPAGHWSRRTPIFEATGTPARSPSGDRLTRFRRASWVAASPSGWRHVRRVTYSRPPWGCSTARS